MRRRSFEEHVLEEMAHAGRAGDLVAAPDVIPDPERNDGRVMRFERMDHEPVVEAARQRDVDVWDRLSLREPQDTAISANSRDRQAAPPHVPRALPSHPSDGRSPLSSFAGACPPRACPSLRWPQAALL